MYNIIISIIQKKIAASLNDNATVIRAFYIHPLLRVARTMYSSLEREREREEQKRETKKIEGLSAVFFLFFYLFKMEKNKKKGRKIEREKGRGRKGKID